MQSIWNYIERIFPDNPGRPLKGAALKLHFTFSILAIPVSMLLYWLLFMYVPTLSMVTVSGTLTDSRYYVFRSGRGSGYAYLFLKLDSHLYPVKIVEKRREVFTPKAYKNKPLINDHIEVHIRKNELERLDQNILTLPLQKYDIMALRRYAFPQAYGLKINGREIVSPQAALWNNLGLGAILALIFLPLIWIFCLVNIRIGYGMLRETKI